MSGAPTLVQLVILLICLPILRTMTAGNISHGERKDIILHILDNDKCAQRYHPLEDHTQCQEALHHFSKLSEYDRWDCPNARDAACRPFFGDRRCTFVCDPAPNDILAAEENVRVTEPIIKSLWVAILPIKRHANDSEEEKQRRRERQEQREQRQLQYSLRQQARIQRRRQEYLALRGQQNLEQQQSLQPESQQQQSLQPESQQQQQPFSFSYKETTRVKRRQRREILKGKRSQRLGLQQQ